MEDAAVAFTTRAGGARETEKIFSSKHESVAGILIDPFVGLAVHKAAGRVEDFPGPAVSSDAAVAFATRAGGARETEKIFRQNIETEAGVIGGAVEKVGAITAGAVEKVGAVHEAVEEVVAGGLSIRLLIRV